MSRRRKTADMVSREIMDKVSKAILPLSNEERADVLYDLVEQLGEQLDQEYSVLVTADESPKPIGRTYSPCDYQN